MIEGGIEMDDLVTIIGEQTILLRLRSQEKAELEAEIERLTDENTRLKRMDPQ